MFYWSLTVSEQLYHTKILDKLVSVLNIMNMIVSIQVLVLQWKVLVHNFFFMLLTISDILGCDYLV